MIGNLYIDNNGIYWLRSPIDGEECLARVSDNSSDYLLPKLTLLDDYDNEFQPLENANQMTLVGQGYEYIKIYSEDYYYGIKIHYAKMDTLIQTVQEEMNKANTFKECFDFYQKYGNLLKTIIVYMDNKNAKD